MKFFKKVKFNGNGSGFYRWEELFYERLISMMIFWLESYLVSLWVTFLLLFGREESLLAETTKDCLNSRFPSLSIVLYNLLSPFLLLRSIKASTALAMIGFDIHILPVSLYITNFCEIIWLWVAPEKASSFAKLVILLFPN